MNDDIEYQDVYLECLECGDEFVFEAGEQAFYVRNNLSLPKRCPQCRLIRKLHRKPLVKGDGNEL